VRIVHYYRGAAQDRSGVTAAIALWQQVAQTSGFASIVLHAHSEQSQTEYTSSRTVVHLGRRAQRPRTENCCLPLKRTLSGRIITSEGTRATRAFRPYQVSCEELGRFSDVPYRVTGLASAKSDFSRSALVSRV